MQAEQGEGDPAGPDTGSATLSAAARKALAAKLATAAARQAAAVAVDAVSQGKGTVAAAEDAVQARSKG